MRRPSRGCGDLNALSVAATTRSSGDGGLSAGAGPTAMSDRKGRPTVADLPHWYQYGDPRIELDREVDGRWIADLVDVPGAIAYGDTPRAAIDAARAVAEAINPRWRPWHENAAA